MTTIRMIRPRHSMLSVFLLVALAGCATHPSTSVTSNVPSDRLSHETSTSPDGAFTVTLPPLKQPGAKFTLEKISDESKARELFLENRYVDSDRGKELRLVGLRKEGSPLVSQKREGDELVTRKDDLYRADSIFKHGVYMYEVSAGVTASQGQSEDALFAEAKRNLDAFLKGLKIQ